MANKPTYEELEKSVKNLKREVERLRDVDEMSRESEEHLRSFMENAKGFAVYRLSVDPEDYYRGHVIFVSPSLKDIIGVSPQDEFSEWFKNVHEDDLPSLINAQNKSIGTGTTFEQEFRLRNLEGGWRWIHAISNPVFDSEGKTKYYNGIILDVTAHKQADEALKVSEKRLNAILDAMTEAMLLLDREGIVHAANQILFDRLETSKEEIVGKRVFDFFPPDVAETRRKKYYEVFNTGKPVLFEDSRDGMIFEQSVCPILDDGNQVIMIAVFAKEITERKQAEEALQESEAFLKTLINAIPAPVFYKDSDGKYLGFNSAFETFFGETRERLIGKSVFEINPPKLAETYRAKDDELFTSGGAQLYESQMKNVHGKLRDIKFHKAVFTDNKGVVTGLIGTFVDITEEKRALEALRESEEKYRNLVEDSFDGIFIQKGQKILFSNKRLSKMLGYNEGELVGQNHWIVYHPDYQKLTRERAQARIRGEDVLRRYEVKLLRKDDSWFYGEINALPIIFPSDKENGIQVWVKDIHERKQAEEALRESELRMDLAMEGGNIGLWDWNLRNGEIFFDRRWHRSLGYSTGDLKPHYTTWEKVIHPGDWPETQKELKNCLRGKTPFYENEARLKCKSGQWRWMLARAKIMERDRNGKALRVTGIHQDINGRKLMEIELQAKTLELEESNTALKVLVSRREKDKEDLGEKVLSNVKSLVEPYLKELKNSQVDPRQIVFLGLLESGLKNITSSFSSKLSSKYLGLTPGELQVAYLIREGKKTKEIAALLNLSSKTIEDYRKNLRKKLEIRNMKINLRTHLLSIHK